MHQYSYKIDNYVQPILTHTYHVSVIIEPELVYVFKNAFCLESNTNSQPYFLFNVSFKLIHLFSANI